MGGLERNTFTLASSLAKMGHETKVLTETLDEDGGAAYPFATVRSSSPGAFFGCVRWADLVFVNGGLSMKVCTISRFLGRRYVPIYQMSTLFEREGAGWFSKRARAFMAAGAGMSLTVSHYAKTVLEGLLPGHEVVALPNPIDGELEQIVAQKKGLAADKSYDLLFAGRLIDGKGIFHLLEAVSKLRPSHELTVAFAGDGADRDRLLARAEALGLGIVYLGRLDRERLIDAYQRSRVLVVPSSTHTEGNPLVIAEALSLGVPVIASDQPAMVEAVGEAGLVFKRGSVDDLSEKIGLMFGHGQLEERAGLTFLRKAEFSYERYNERLKGVLGKMGA